MSIDDLYDLQADDLKDRKLWECIANARHKLFEQDLVIQDLLVDIETARRTIGQLRAQIAILNGGSGGMDAKTQVNQATQIERTGPVPE